MCSDGERAWRGHTRCGGVGRGPAGGPGRWRGTSRGADVPETGLPAGRKWVKPRCRPGAAGLFFVGGAKGIPDGPLLRQEREEKTRTYVLLSAGKGMERGLSVPGGFVEWEGAHLEATGGKEAAFPTGEQRAGRRAGGGGLHSSSRRLAPSGFVGRLSEALPNSGLTGRNPLLFCSQEGKKWGGGSCAAMLWPRSSACLVYTHMSLSSIFPDALCGGVKKLDSEENC